MREAQGGASHREQLQKRKRPRPAEHADTPTPPLPSRLRDFEREALAWMTDLYEAIHDRIESQVQGAVIKAPWSQLADDVRSTLRITITPSTQVHTLAQRVEACPSTTATMREFSSEWYAYCTLLQKLHAEYALRLRRTGHGTPLADYLYKQATFADLFCVQVNPWFAAHDIAVDRSSFAVLDPFPMQAPLADTEAVRRLVEHQRTRANAYSYRKLVTSTLVPRALSARMRRAWDDTLGTVQDAWVSHQAQRLSTLMSLVDRAIETVQGDNRVYLPMPVDESRASTTHTRANMNEWVEYANSGVDLDDVTQRLDEQIELSEERRRFRTEELEQLCSFDKMQVSATCNDAFCLMQWSKAASHVATEVSRGISHMPHVVEMFEETRGKVEYLRDLLARSKRTLAEQIEKCGELINSIRDDVSAHRAAVFTLARHIDDSQAHLCILTAVRSMLEQIRNQPDDACMRAVRTIFTECRDNGIDVAQKVTEDTLDLEKNLFATTSRTRTVMRKNCTSMLTLFKASLRDLRSDVWATTHHCRYKSARVSPPAQLGTHDKPPSPHADLPGTGMREPLPAEAASHLRSLGSEACAALARLESETGMTLSVVNQLQDKTRTAVADTDTLGGAWEAIYVFSEAIGAYLLLTTE